MLSDAKMTSPSTQAKAHACLCLIFRITCTLKLVPYHWNCVTQRLSKLNMLGWTVFCAIACLSPASCTFMVVRYLQAQNLNPPIRIRVLNIIWGLAYALVFLCKMQVMVRANEIMAFGNSLLEEREKVLAREKVLLEEEEAKKEQNQNDKTSANGKPMDWISLIIFGGTFLLFMNPPLHAVVLLDMPCAPQYWSSLLLPCKWMGDSPVPLIQLTPYLLWEYFAITDMMTIVAFLWGIIFMGLNWIKDETLTYMTNDISTNEIPQEETADKGPTIKSAKSAKPASHKLRSHYITAALEYRRVQVRTRFVNDAFNLYLQYWPSLIYLIGGTMLFAAIRFTHLALHIFLVFPACGIRCVLEITTQMEAAANVNLASERYLRQVESQARAAMMNKDTAFAKYLTRFRKSCTKLTCNAGSLYTLEKSIVLVSLHHCTQLIFNLLVAFPTAQEGNWGQKLVQVNSTKTMGTTN